MAFLIFERTITPDGSRLRNTDEHYKLSGSENLIYRAWKEQGSPDRGWQVSADELIKIHSNGAHSKETRRLLIDWIPSSKKQIGLIELEKIIAYTYCEGNNSKEKEAIWTPLMLFMQDTYYHDPGRDLQLEEKNSKLKDINEANDKQFIEFLYLQGDARGWNWGRNGMTNAAFIGGRARDFFREYF
jgi:hypothetical protein